MDPFVAQRRAPLAELCRRHHVRRLDLFGSAATARFDQATSDLDFLVEFEPLAPADYADAWFGLREDLERLFGVPIDLITRAGLANPYFAASVMATRELVYAG
jgi:predicted nucleotidyltransferase